MNFFTNLFSSNKPNSFSQNIDYKKSYLEYINVAKNIAQEIYSNYKDTINSYVDSSIEITLNQFLGSGLTKIVLPKITNAVKQISSNIISYVDSYVESYVKAIEENIEISTDYSNIAHNTNSNLIAEELDSIILVGEAN